MEKVSAEIVPFVVGVVFSAGALVAILRMTQRDVNGLGRKHARMIAFNLRALAMDEPIKREKLLYLADLIDPK